MMVCTPNGRVFAGVCEPREATTETGLARDVKGEVAAMCNWCAGEKVSLVMCCPSGDWPGGKDLDRMASAFSRRAGVTRKSLKMEEVPPEYFDKDTFRFFEAA